MKRVLHDLAMQQSIVRSGSGCGGAYTSDYAELSIQVAKTSTNGLHDLIVVANTTTFGIDSNGDLLPEIRQKPKVWGTLRFDGERYGGRLFDWW